jgi:hypothetical protein
VRVLRPPIPIEVHTEDPADGHQSSLTPRPIDIVPVIVEGSKALEIRGRVRVASGPWEVEEGWWQESPVRREYWDVELDRGGIFRIYRDLMSEEWVADGIYD